MAVTEIYLKLSVTFPDDPKVRSLARYGVDGNLARDLYVQMCLHCKRLLTDGFVPDEQIGLLAYPLPPDHAKQLAKQLASVGLINEEADGWRVLAYLKRNGTREDVEYLSRVRAESGYKGGTARRKPRKSAGQSSREASGSNLLSNLPSGLEATSNPYTETETDTETGSSNPLVAASGNPPPTQPRRGTRLPENFPIPVDQKDWFAEHCPHVDVRFEHQRFVNHWVAKAGRDATKVDWVATWRNWMLKSEQEAPRTNGQRRSTADDNAAATQALKARLGQPDQPTLAIEGGTQ